MRLPFAITTPLSGDLADRWVTEFEGFGGRDRTIEEGIWRRTQDELNAEESGRLDERDARRRVLHYHYRFGLTDHGEGAQLALETVYIYHSLALPRPDIDAMERRWNDALKLGGWVQAGAGWELGDLRVTIRRSHVHEEDQKAGRLLPQSYDALDAMLSSESQSMLEGRRSLPWEVLARGMRKRDVRGEPTYMPSLSELASHVPIQVELGCGVSTEAGVPPLHVLHDWYSVTDHEDRAFIFGGPKDVLMEELLTDPFAALTKRSQMMAACLRAEPTPAHRALRALVDSGDVLGPILTNNFDGLHLRLGLEECYIRRYDEDVPFVPIHPETRALLVVGSHADRRKVQKRFRDQGLPVFFLDTEGFGELGSLNYYPIEGAQSVDSIRKAGAAEGLLELAEALGVSVD